MPTAIIADDEDLQRTDLRRMLALAWPELEIIAECEDGGEALDAIIERQPDIAFLDIRMPDLSGLDVARASDGKCRVVFTTAFDSHAIEAFQLGALDYLLKPIQQDRLRHTVTRLQSQLTMAAVPSPDLLGIMSELERRLRTSKQTERLRWISASSGKTIQIIPVEDVLFFESDTRYTRVVTAKEEALVRTPIKDLQEGLDHEQFWQIRRGLIVNASAIFRARRDELGVIKVELRDHQEQLKVSHTYAWRFKGM